MTQRVIHLGALSFPLELITLRIALYGASGAGKTTAARLFAEQVSAAGHRFAAIDLKNDWYGLKSSADGESAGIPAVIFGGPRKDVQLFEDSGALVADTVAGIEQSVVLDLDAFSKGKQLRFLAQFMERLYDVNREPLLLICDEADRYASQKPMSPEAIVALGASEDIARRARKRGIGSLWLTQRTAVLNKNVADLCDLTIVFRTPGARDLDELEDRVGRLATKEQVRDVMKLAPGLENGEAIFLSTHPLLRAHLPATIRPVQLPMPWTFDSSATPGLRQRRREPKVLASADLVAIEQRMAATIERAKADDPKTLKADLARVKGELEKAIRQKPIAAPPAKTVEKLVLTDADRALLEKVGKRLDDVAGLTTNINAQAVVLAIQTAVGVELNAFAHDIHAKQSKGRDEFIKLCESKGFQKILDTLKAVELPTQNSQPFAGSLPAAVSNDIRSRSASGASDSTPLKAIHRAMLTALAQHPDGLTKKQILIHANYSSNGNTGAAFADLVRDGLADAYQPGALRITAAGIQALGTYEPLPIGDALRASLLAGDKLSTMEKAILQEICAPYPADSTKGEILTRAKYSSNGNTGAAFAKLVALGYAVSTGPARLKAAEELFG